MTGTNTCPRCKGTGQVADRRARLVVQDVDRIRELNRRGVSVTDIAYMLGVHKSSISRILNGKQRA